MLHDLLFVLWFFLPAAEANMAPIFAAKIPGIRKWNAPMDCGKTWRGKRLLGAHKTWRGLVSGIIAATLTLWLEQWAARHLGWAQDLSRQVDYPALPTLVVGPLFAVGALGGDALKSFFKRRRGIPPGEGWFPFDQLDYLIGSSLAVLPFIRLTLVQYLWLILLGLLLHMAATYIGWLLKLKEHPL